jgi:hypothetical protein
VEPVPHISKEAHVRLDAAGIVLAVVPNERNAIGREAGLRSVLEHRPS